jgi:hypothetical protein
MRQGAGLESVKDGDRKQGGFKCGMTVPGQRENKRPGGDMEMSVGEHTTESSQPCPKGRNRGKISVLEEAYGE